MKLLKTIVIAAFLLVGGIGVYFYHFANTPLVASESTNKIEFDLLRGMRPIEISQALVKAGLVDSATRMYWLGKFTHDWAAVKSADYELSPSMTPLQILSVFRSGIGIQHSILVREGDNIYQVAESFSNLKLGTQEEVLRDFKSQEFIASVGLGQEGIRSLEGYLFPNTYFYDRRDSAENVIKRMVTAFLRMWTPEYDARAQELRMSRKQIVTLASMIEKETGAGFERPIISSVFHNRLKKRMRLQSDPTTIYGMWSHYTGNIHKKDLLAPTEYNTYTVTALPIGPIANPNPESVKAALYPAETDYIYFVSKNDGTHRFSKTYQEHANWVRELQMNPKAREGKSWRDLKKHGASE